MAKRQSVAPQEGSAKHPIVYAWREFAANNSSLFSDGANGIYLENRLSRAFTAGWDAAEAAMKRALGDGR